MKCALLKYPKFLHYRKIITRYMAGIRRSAKYLKGNWPAQEYLDFNCEYLIKLNDYLIENTKELKKIKELDISDDDRFFAYCYLNEIIVYDRLIHYETDVLLGGEKLKSYENNHTAIWVKPPLKIEFSTKIFFDLAITIPDPPVS